ncbi:MAG: PKD domain-containing protein, partial [Bacteroidales bacterium]|nr:PKD domain-containing protein [Bacteroidales bacterium]
GDTTKDIRYQNPNPSTYGAKIKSIVVDNSNNLSQIAYHDLNVDWTPPVFNGVVIDGSNYDIDTLMQTQYVAKWDKFYDANSGIKEYLVSIGTQQGSDNILSWQTNNLDTFLTIDNTSLVPGQYYYFNVRAVNNAGLSSNIYSSDGFIYLPNGNLPYASFYVQDTIVCSGVSIQIINNSFNADSFLWIMPGANPNVSHDYTPQVVYNVPGTYTIVLIAYNQNGSDTLIRNNYVKVIQGPVFNITYNNLSENPPYYVIFNNQSQFVDSVLWNFGDGTTSTDWSPYHIYNSSGVYNVSVYAKNQNCENTYNFVLSLFPVVVNDNTLDNYVIIYPNPIQDELNIISSEKIEFLKITSIDGKVLYENSINSSLIKLNLNTFNAGMYILTVATKKDITNKIIICE